MFDRSKITRVGWTLAVVSGLLFGGFEAVEGTALHSCTYSPPTFLGSCNTGRACEQMCSTYFDNFIAICDDFEFGHGCCTCIEA